MAEKTEINFPTYHYCGYARDLMERGTDQAMKTLEKHIPECLTCLPAQNSEEFASAADAIGKNLK
ncbi:hypothetical protein HY085_00775, partial [Candidatus Gottesmanbacteria bacterium]|nr:hypothetical protein [Candidatus Gottesmanbacteria bacterium]